MDGELKNLIRVGLPVLASLCYCYYIVSKVPKGKLRLFSLLPIFIIFSLLPLHLSLVFPSGITGFFITWLANFKLLLFSFDKGPLSSDQPKSLLLFISIACFPIKIESNKQNPSHQNLEKAPKLPLNFVVKFLVLAVLIWIYEFKKHALHPKLILVMYCCLLYLFLDIILAFSNALARSLIGIELEPPSDEPYLATSLQDFWGRRWNLIVTNILRHTVYQPVRSTLATVLGRKSALLMGVVAAFVVSGLMHELIFFYVTRVSPTWEVTWFFVLQGVCVTVEIAAKKAFAGWWELHWAVSGPLTVGFVSVTGFWLFFPPLVRNGADVRAIGECIALAEFVKEKLSCIL